MSRHRAERLQLIVLLGLGAMLAGCLESDQGDYGSYKMSPGVDLTEKFVDNAQSNVDAPMSIDELIFFSSEHNRKYVLADEIGESNVVLVFTRGYSGGRLCPYCSTQTAQLAAKKQEFEQRDAKVLIVYPGTEEHLMDFETAVAEASKQRGEAPEEYWPVLLDKDLTAVNLLDIAGHLALPSTFIIDKQGKVVFSYVGANRFDRPSVQSILDQLDALQPVASGAN